MELNHLRYFYEVAKAGSFTAAAKNLRVSQPALSKTVATLEEHEGVKLLERGKKGVALTIMGEMVYARCSVIFRELEDLSDQVRGRKARCEGPLRMGASDHIANYLLPPVLVEFHRTYPGVLPSVYTGTPTEIAGRILDRDLELGFFFTRVESPHLEYHEIANVEFVAVFHPTMRTKLPTGNAQRKEFLSKLGFIGSRSRDYRKAHPAQSLLETLGAERRILLETNNQETQKQLCMAGYGYAVLPRFMVELELKSKKLVEIPGPGEMVVPILMAQRKNHILSLPSQKFSEDVIARAARR